jgi:O-methyltransferase involved in polyketide biosynthesis
VLPLLAKCLPSRKPPIINRGTWARHAAMRQVTADFVTACVQHTQQQQQQQDGTADSSRQAQAGGQDGSGVQDCLQQPVCQVVSLGAGSDSSWFSLQQQGWPLLPAVHYIELDYHEVGALGPALCKASFVQS